MTYELHIWTVSQYLRNKHGDPSIILHQWNPGAARKRIFLQFFKQILLILYFSCKLLLVIDSFSYFFIWIKISNHLSRTNNMLVTAMNMLEEKYAYTMMKAARTSWTCTHMCVYNIQNVLVLVVEFPRYGAYIHENVNCASLFHADSTGSCITHHLQYSNNIQTWQWTKPVSWVTRNT